MLTNSRLRGLGMNVIVYAPPVLSISPVSGNAPLTVNATFSNVSPSIATAEADWGDGNLPVQVSLSSAQYTYKAAGTYTPKFSFMDTSGAVVAVLTSPAIAVAQSIPIIAGSIVADKTSGASPLTVNFKLNITGGSLPSAGNVDWDFGDGTVTKIPNNDVATHTYLTAGTYTVKATVYNSAGVSSILSGNLKTDGLGIISFSPTTLETFSFYVLSAFLLYGLYRVVKG